MSDETTLLPCPFCGGEAKIMNLNHGTWVECSNYHYERHQVCVHAKTEAEAIAAWNTRAKLENVTCGQCKHSRTERHTGDEQLVCWVRGTHGEVVPDDGYCFKGEL